MADIYDNSTGRMFVDGLRRNITAIGVKRVDFCVGYFNLRGWDQIDEQIDKLPGEKVWEKDELQQDVQKTTYCRLLIGMHRPEEELIRELYTYHEPELMDSEQMMRCKMKIAADFRRQLQIGTPTNTDEKTLRHLAEQLENGRLRVKLYLRRPLHAKLYLAYRDDDMSPRPTILGSSNLTYAGMTGNGELDTQIPDKDNTKKLADWFEEHWNDEKCLDITTELLKVINESWAANTEMKPYYIYLKTAYHLSQDARAGIAEYSLPPQFQHDLFDFQQTAVKIAVHHLRNDKLNGAMIGDVVGLGKTITACAVAKIYEMNFAATTLIICPANLQDMWWKYVRMYDLKAEVMSKDKKFDENDMRYYKLVIVDESHNLRNREGARYQNIKRLIEHQDCKVLLLSATPYNKDYSDLSNQLRLFLDEDADLGIRPENFIEKCGGERKFMRDYPDVPIRSIRAFEKSDDPDDWNELMKLFLVRRTRTFIKDNYAHTAEDGRKYLQFPDGTKSFFPDRVPKALTFHTEKGDQYSRLYSEHMNSLMADLLLPRYGLSEYINAKELQSADKATKQNLENLSRAGRRMMGFCRSTFYKRMDSSGFAFLLTLYRHALRNMVYLYAIEKNLLLPVSDENALPEDYLEDMDMSADLFDTQHGVIDALSEKLSVPTDLKIYREKAIEYYGNIQNKNGITWVEPKYFTTRLKTHLKRDCDTIIKMIEHCGDWAPRADQKLSMLENLLNTTHRGEKVLIFTQYADTANYIKNELVKWGHTDIACATGNSVNPTSLAERFSPVSNNVEVPEANQLRILVATDVLSEGQNLQDAHVIVNYDLPWAIIRLIQRAGRVDRIGQQAEKIFCYSFFPADGVESIINLRKRLNERINENAGVLGSDEIFFEGNEQNLRDMFNERSGILDDTADDDVDLGSMAYQIWKNATDARPELKTIVPMLENVVYSTKAATTDQPDSVITYARTYNDFDVLTWVDKNGTLISNSQKRILMAMACEYDTPAQERMENHHDVVRNAVANIRLDSQSSSGTLGNRLSTRYRVWTLLDDYYNTHPIDIFFSEEKRQQVKMAMNDIYQFPLLESVKFTLGQMLSHRSRMGQDDIVDYIVEAHKNNNFCRVEEEQTSSNHDAQIICSMGIRNI